MAKHDALVAHIHFTCMQLKRKGTELILDILFMHTKEPCLSSVKPQPRPDRPVTRHTRPITNNVRRARLEPDPDPHNLRSLTDHSLPYFRWSRPRSSRQIFWPGLVI